jgi:hypothetical protein
MRKKRESEIEKKKVLEGKELDKYCRELHKSKMEQEAQNTTALTSNSDVILMKLNDMKRQCDIESDNIHHFGELLKNAQQRRVTILKHLKQLENELIKHMLIFKIPIEFTPVLSTLKPTGRRKRQVDQGDPNVPLLLSFPQQPQQPQPQCVEQEVRTDQLNHHHENEEDDFLNNTIIGFDVDVNEPIQIDNTKYFIEEHF